MRLSFLLHFVIVFVMVAPFSLAIERLLLTGLIRDPVYRPVIGIIGTCFLAVCVVGLGMPWIGDLPAAIGLSGLAMAIWRVRQGRRERAAAGYRPAEAARRYGITVHPAPAEQPIEALPDRAPNQSIERA